MGWTKIIGLWLFGILTCGAFAQTGSIDPTAGQMAGVQPFVAPTLELIEEKVVDLRPWMPPVGEQRMNDCTAWAVAYGAKTYLEARDQGWRPVSAGQIFSPRFVYNQINSGKDDGSNILAAARLMREKGCATLATTPYVPGDFQGQPSQRALAEAQAFPVHDVRKLADRTAVRRALQRRQVVVFGAHVNPIFLGGKFDVYTAGLFSKDETLRQPGQQHGKHAMCVVGYDDGKQAFLIQNSWGTAWSQRGYAWVSYDLFDIIRIAGDNEGVFCNWAFTIEDIEEKVERGADGMPRPAPVDLQTLGIKGYSDVVRFDVDQKKYLYTFNASLRGQRAALAGVKQVAWTWKDAQGNERSVQSDIAVTHFGIIGSANTNPLKLRAVVTLADGSTRTLTQDIAGPIPRAEFRDAAILFDDQYHSRLRDGRPFYFWNATLDVPLNDRDDIVKVVWKVGEMGGEDQVMTGFNGPPATERAIGFVTEARGEIAAEIHYSDGGVKRITHRPVIDDPARDEPVIDVAARELSTDVNGDTTYAWTLTIDRPREQDTKIEKVVYTLDPMFGGGASYTTGMLHQDFALSGTSHRDFRARATIHYNDGTTRTLDRWVELGAKARYADARRLQLHAFDVYRGRHDGAPLWWTYYRVVGDSEQIARIEKVDYTLPDIPDRSASYDKHNGDLTFPWILPVTDQPLQAHAVVTFGDGSTTTLDRTHTPISPPNDAVGIAVSMSEPTAASYSDVRDACRYRADLIGPAAEIDDVRSVDWRYRVRNRNERTVVSPGTFQEPATFGFGSTADGSFDLEAIVTFADGFEERLVVPLKMGVSNRAQSALRLRVREKFNGFDKETGAPQWIARSSITGDARRLDAIRGVVYRYHAPWIAGDVHESAAERNPSVGLLCERPADIEAIVTFDDGATQTLTGRIRADAPRPAAPFVVRQARDWLPSPGAVPFWKVWIDGYESEMERVKSVFYDCDNDFFDRLSERRDDERSGYNYAVSRRTLGTEPLGVTITLDDGTTRKLHVDAGEPYKPLRWLSRSRYWGDGKWQIDISLDGEINQLRGLWGGTSYVADQNAIFLEPVPTVPYQNARAIVPAGEWSLREVQYSPTLHAIERLSGGPLPLEGERLEALELRGRRDTTQPADATRKAWTLHVAGPERDLSRIARVAYRVNDQYDHLTDRRWGEFEDGFEMRWITRYDTVQATALVTFEDGTTMELKWSTP